METSICRLSGCAALKVAKRLKKYEIVYVSTSPVVAKKLENQNRTYIVGECNRRSGLRILRVLRRCMAVAWTEKPDVVVSAGAAPGLVMCAAAKLMGAKIGWIDSIANIERLSMSGRIVRPVADLFLTQWDELAAKYANVEYAGNLL